MVQSKAVQVLKEMELSEFKRRYPENPYPIAKKYKVSKANGLTQAIIKLIKLSGFQAERISTSGRVIDQSKVVTNVMGQRYRIGSSKYIPGTGTKGSADISATISGRSVKIEVKIGADRQSPAQKQYQQDIERAGGVYVIASSFDQFYEWLDGFTKNQ
jgi:hypothetical protein